MITYKAKETLGFLIILFLNVCGIFVIGFFLGYKGNTIEYVYKESEPLDSWQLLELAIIKTESDFNAQAIGTKNDIGVFQITPIYVNEVNRLLDTLKYSHIDAFDIEKSLEMFEVYQSVKNPDRDIEKAINLHNPNGASIDYATKVLSNYRYLVRMEEVRTQIAKR